MQHTLFAKLIHALAAFLFSLAPLTLRADIIFDTPTLVMPCAPGQAVVVAEFKFRVAGNAPLRVSEIRTDYDCTTAKADAENYAAGTSGKINVKFTTGERYGLQRKKITVRTSDGKEATAFLQTTVPRILKITPAFLMWKENESAAPKESKVTLLMDKVSGSQTAVPPRITGIEIRPAGRFFRFFVGNWGKHANKGYLCKKTPA
ncbi:MAG: DUF1573 domain-containing protein [Puniceicoccales bacterium]|jgi:hypothetical protein|nr:DUF1573 domain-containing protein [Puniceicoccales bacterium]